MVDPMTAPSDRPKAGAASTPAARDDEVPDGFGYFSATDQQIATFDPGQFPCLVCGQPWTTETVRTISFMPMTRGRSYFYRIHKACDTVEATRAVESRVIDGRLQ